MKSSKLFHPLAQPSVRPQDRRRLLPHLASTGTLNSMLVLDSVTTTDLQRMLLLETERPQGARYPVVRKLVARILSRERHRMVATVYAGTPPSA